MTDSENHTGTRTRAKRAKAVPASRHRRRAHKAKRHHRWPWFVLVFLLILALVPVVLFGYSYSQYTVPQPQDLANKQVATIYASDGQTQLARLVPPEGNRTQVSLEQIPDTLENAALAAEDREFWTNSGFSFTGFARAILGALTGNDTAGGGSTITQQYVKNTLVGDERSYVRKLRELFYSIKMTREWDKATILNAYLNTVYFGRGAYGVQAAANAYFNKPVEALNVEESALLAALIQAPSSLDPAVNFPASQQRWNYVLDGMVEMGVLPAAQRAGMVYPVTRNPAEYSPYTEAAGPNGHIKNQVIRELAEIGISEQDVQTRGLQIVTTIDMRVQNASIAAVDKNLAPLQADARAAAVTIDPRTGAVRGYFGGHDPTGWDYANAPLQTGSTFKIVGLAAALQQGIGLDTLYSSRPYKIAGTDIMVNNFDGGSGCGSCSIAEALKQSYNPSFQRLQDDLEHKAQDTADMGHALGIPAELPGIGKTLSEQGGAPYLGVILGQYPSRPIDMATVMATITQGGLWHKPHFVQRITTNSGEVLYDLTADPGERRVSYLVATNVLKAMGPIAAWSNGALADGRPSASKTGTSQLGNTGNNRDTWMLGSTPQLATAVWVGTADNTTAIFNQWGGIMYGSGAATKIWKSILDTSLEGQEKLEFPKALPVKFGDQNAGAGTAYSYSDQSSKSSSGTGTSRNATGTPAAGAGTAGAGGPADGTGIAGGAVTPGGAANQAPAVPGAGNAQVPVPVPAPAQAPAQAPAPARAPAPADLGNQIGAAINSIFGT